MRRTPWLAWIGATLVAASGCTELASPPPRSETFSFEGTLEGWRVVAIDTGVQGGAHAPWSIVPSRDASTDGEWSVKLSAANYTDAVKLWIERSYAVTPGAGNTYDVTVDFDFGTTDQGNVNLWRVVTGAYATLPRSSAAIEAAARGETGGATSGLTWISQQRTMRVHNVTDSVYVVIGVWGTFESVRTYFVDDVRVTLRPL